MDNPDIIDIHIHLCRDTQQEKVVFPKTGWPDKWYWASPDKVIPYMDARGISHVATMNIIDTNRMVEMRVGRARSQGASDADIAEARVTLADDMRQRVRAFNDVMCEAAAKEPRIIPYVMVDPILFGTMVAVNLQAAFLSPPVAMSAFYLKGVAPKHVTLNQIFAGMMPYMLIVILCLAMMYIWPGMTLWLPKFLYGG